MPKRNQQTQKDSNTSLLDKEEKSTRPARSSKQQKIAVTPQEDPQEAFRVVTGSYERLLYGLDAYWNRSSADSKPRLTLNPVFIYPSHVGCIKAVAVGGKFLASGSSDEIIKLYDLRRRKELGSLMQHKGAITALYFHGKTHMLSASEDGNICIWRTSDWECLKMMTGHSARVNDISIHPTGKIALSVSADKTLRLWNLMNGRRAVTTKLEKEAESVQFTPSGSHYGVLFSHSVDIYRASDAKVCQSISVQSRLGCMKTHRDGNGESGKEYVLAGGEDKCIRAYDVESGKEVAVFTGHKNRIKAISIVQVLRPNYTSTTTTTSNPELISILVSISSDGAVKVWDLDTALNASTDGTPAEVTEPVGTYETNARLVCVSTAVGPEGQKKLDQLTKETPVNMMEEEENK